MTHREDANDFTLNTEIVEDEEEEKPAEPDAPDTWDDGDEDDGFHVSTPGDLN